MFNTVNLPNSSVEDIEKLRKFVSFFIGDELSKTSIPCHYIKTIRKWEDLLKLTGLNDNVLKEFKNSIIPKKLRTAKIITDKQTLLILYCIAYFFKIRKFDLVKLFFQLLAVKFYANRVHAHMSRHCNPEVWNLAMDNLSSKHLYKNKGGIGAAILYLAETEFRKKRDIFLKTKDLNEGMFLVNIIYHLRHRIQQSFRSFANLYFKIIEEDKVTFSKIPEDELENIQTKSSQIISDKISALICTYSQIDQYALGKSVGLSGLKQEIALSILSQISSPENLTQVRFIIILIDRILELKKVCLEKKRQYLVRKVEKGIKIGNYIVKNEILNLLYSLEIAHELKKLNKSQLVIFLTNYLTLFVRNRIC
jgi:hypothetical protein